MTTAERDNRASSEVLYRPQQRLQCHYRSKALYCTYSTVGLTRSLPCPPSNERGLTFVLTPSSASRIQDHTTSVPYPYTHGYPIPLPAFVVSSPSARQAASTHTYLPYSLNLNLPGVIVGVYPSFNISRPRSSNSATTLPRITHH